MITVSVYLSSTGREFSEDTVLHRAVTFQAPPVPPEMMDPDGTPRGALDYVMACLVFGGLLLPEFQFVTKYRLAAHRGPDIGDVVFFDGTPWLATEDGWRKLSDAEFRHAAERIAA